MFWTGAVAPPKEGHPSGGRRPGLRAIPPLRCRRVVCRRCRDIRPRTLPYPVSSAWRTAADRLRGALGRDMRLRSPSLSLAYHIRRHRPCCCARTGRIGHHALVLVPVANRSAPRNRKTPAFSRPLISAPSQNAASGGRLAGSMRSGLVSSLRLFRAQSDRHRRPLQPDLRLGAAIEDRVEPRDEGFFLRAAKRHRLPKEFDVGRRASPYADPGAGPKRFGEIGAVAKTSPASGRSVEARLMLTAALTQCPAGLSDVEDFSGPFPMRHPCVDASAPAAGLVDCRRRIVARHCDPTGFGESTDPELLQNLHDVPLFSVRPLLCN